MPVASKDGIRDRRRQTDHRALARSRRRKVLAIEQNSLDHGQIAEPRNAILRKPAIQDSAVLELDGLEQRAAQSLTFDPSI